MLLTFLFNPVANFREVGRPRRRAWASLAAEMTSFPVSRSRVGQVDLLGVLSGGDEQSWHPNLSWR